MEVTDQMRIVLLGKTGAGKSKLGNTILGEELFNTIASSSSITKNCQAQTRDVHGRNITLIDTPGFFDSHMPEEQFKSERVRCVVECAPGPHAFLIVLPVGRYTPQEKEVIENIHQYFSPEAFRFAVVVFTHGDNLDEDQTIQQFVSQNEGLSDLVEKCGGRCHVVDNKYWNNNQDPYRNNQVQVEQLLNTVDQMVLDNNGGFYTNEMLQAAERDIEMEEAIIGKQMPENTPEEEIRSQATANVSNRWLISLAGVGTGVLLGALLGVGVVVYGGYIILKNTGTLIKVADTVAGGVVAAGAVAGGAAVVVGGAAVIGVVHGGVTGYKAAQDANTAWEAVQNTATAVRHNAKMLKKAADSMFDSNYCKRIDNM